MKIRVPSKANICRIAGSVLLSFVVSILIEFFLFQKNLFLIFDHDIQYKDNIVNISSLYSENIIFDGDNVISLKNPSIYFKSDYYSFIQGIFFEFSNMDSRKIQVRIYCSDADGKYSDAFFSGKISLKRKTGYIPIGHYSKDLKIVLGDDYSRYVLNSVVINPNISIVLKNMDKTRLLRLYLVCLLLSLGCFFYCSLKSFLYSSYTNFKIIENFSVYHFNVINTVIQLVLCFFLINSFSAYSLVTLYFPNFFYKVFYFLLVVLSLYKIMMMLLEKKIMFVIISIISFFFLYLTHYLSNTGSFIYEFILLAICCYKTDYKRIILSYCFCVGGIIISEITLMLCGVVKNIVYTNSIGFYRHSFGSVYPTDFACSILFVVMSVWTVFKRSFCFISCVTLLVLLCFQYMYTKTRNSEMLMCMCILFVIFYSLFSQKKWISKSLIFNLSFKYAFIFLALLSVSLGFLYDSSNSFMTSLDAIFSSRLSLVNNALHKYGITFIGQSIILIGNGGSIVSSDGYNFIDSSYCLLLIRYGVVCFIIFSLMYIFTQQRMITSGNLKLSIVFFLVAIHSFTEHHYIEYFYNPFLLLLFADLRDSSLKQYVKETK